MLNDPEEAQALAQFCKGDLADSTARSYAAVWREYEEHCAARGKDALDVIQDPGQQDVLLALFIRGLSNKKLAESTIRSKVSAINKVREDLQDCLTKRDLEAVRHKTGEEDTRGVINSTICFKIKELADENLIQYERMRQHSTRHKTKELQQNREELQRSLQQQVATIMGFSLLLRQSSMKALLGKDLVLSETSVEIVVTKEKWKNRPRRMTLQGAIGTWIRKFVAAEVLQPSLERGVLPLFHLLGTNPNLWLKEALHAAQIRVPRNQKHLRFSWHSLRIGGTTALCQPDSPVPRDVVQHWGGWNDSTTIKSYQRYGITPGDQDEFFFGHLRPSSQW